MTSPNQIESSDQKRLQQELQKNAALLGNNKASAHTDWFYDDGMHLNAAGQNGYAEFILEQLETE